MGSVRDTCLANARTALAAVGTPATTIERGRTLPYLAATLPAFVVYPEKEEPEQRVGQPDSPLSECHFLLAIECRDKGGIPDNKLDALLVWAQQKIFADETLGGYALYCRKVGIEWAAVQSDNIYEIATLLIAVCYQELAADPTKRGLSNGT